VIALEKELSGTGFNQARDAVFAIVGRSSQTSLGRELCTYDYRDASGTLLFQTVRYDPKDFRQSHQNLVLMVLKVTLVTNLPI
jgi:hypothetical protein